jgi:membrane protein YqaA with SNARE-associated domain
VFLCNAYKVKITSANPCTTSVVIFITTGAVSFIGSYVDYIFGQAAKELKNNFLDDFMTAVS